MLVRCALNSKYISGSGSSITAILQKLKTLKYCLENSKKTKITSAMNHHNNIRFKGLWMSRVLPLWPLGHQAAHYGAHLSPSLRAPACCQTHLHSITPLVSLTLVPSPGVIVSVSCLCFVHVSCFVLFTVYLLKHSLPELASRLSAHIVTE